MAKAATARRPFRLGLAPKLLGAMILVVIGTVVVMTNRAASELERSQTRSYESKGEAIALSLAAAQEESVGRDLSTVQAGLDSNKVIDGVAYIYFEDADHKVTVHTFSPKFPTGLEAKNPIALGETLPANQRVKIAYVDLPVDDGRISAIDVAAPMGGGALGTVHVGMDSRQIEHGVSELRHSMMLWGVGVALAGIVFGLVVILLTAIRPIKALTRVTAHIVAHDDLTKQISVTASDEIGELAVTFANMVDKLRAILAGLRESSEQVSTSVAELSRTSELGNDTVSRQAAALQETQATVREIQLTSQVAAQKAEAVIRVAERGDQLGREGEQAIEHTLGGLTEIRVQVDAIAAKIGELSERTRQIGQITGTVKSLADQSNMLALNAAIEAVRSGEHGRGFSVVAREIRTLADQSIQATNSVREILEDITTAIRTAVAITHGGAQKMESSLVQVRSSGENLRELSGIVKENSAAVRQIAAAVSQQSAGITQILSAFLDLNALMDSAVMQLDATMKSVTSLKDVTQKASSVVRRFRV
jgi:methyl-accepting chemotaxis protein